MDSIDKKILAILRAEGRISVTELSTRVGLSKTPCQLRVKRLSGDGYILGYRAIVDPSKLGLENVAFVEVRLTDTTEPALKKFNAAVLEMQEVEQCHMIAGAFDYLLKVRTKNMANYRAVLGQKISSLPYVGSTSTHVSMQSVKDEIL